MQMRYLQVLFGVMTLAVTESPSHSQSYILKPAHEIPSFSCASARLSPLERAICANETLADLDAKLGSLFAATKARTSSTEAGALMLSQRDWIKQRNQCVHYKCVVDSYQARIKALAPDVGIASAAVPAEPAGPADDSPMLAKKRVPSLISGTWNFAMGPTPMKAIITPTTFGNECPDKYTVLSVTPSSAHEPEYIAILADQWVCADGRWGTQFAALEINPEDVANNEIDSMISTGCWGIDVSLEDLESFLYGNRKLSCSSNILTRLSHNYGRQKKP